MKRSYLKNAILGLLLTMASASALSAQSWKFGVLADTQWGHDDGRNPGSCAVDIVKATNKEFIKHGVKFVVEVGDLVDKTGSKTSTNAESIANSEDIRAVFAQELYNAGIGFFPLRGNHDGHPLAATEFKRIYPQTLNGGMNVTPANVFSVPNPDAAVQPFPTPSGSPFTLGTHFSSPDPSTTSNLDWRGLTYSFDYENARFILLDQFPPANAGPDQMNLTIDLQQTWISAALAGKQEGGHAFVFGHKGLISENHPDTLFGEDPSKNPTGQDAFITSLYQHGVRYYMQGHDHMHDRSLVSVTGGTPFDGVTPKVENLLCASDSNKFYTPKVPSNDDRSDVPAFGHKRQAQISQDLHKVGFYIFTVDGPRVTGEYYAAQVPNAAPSAKCKEASPELCEYMMPTTPPLTFVKAETFGYSLNGKEFQVCQAGQTNCNSSYAQVADSYKGTTVNILSGTNGSKAQDFDHRSFIKTVDTGWSDSNGDTASNILTLWGMADLGSKQTDVYTLSMTSTPSKSGTDKDPLVLATKAHGKWVNAVDRNQGGTKKFVAGPWKASYELGTYGLDRKTNTAWAVVNYAGKFAVARLDQ